MGLIPTMPLTEEGQTIEPSVSVPTATAPTSLCLVPGDRATVIPAARLPALEPNQLFELTLEPETGSPIGRPTGPVLFVGRAVAL